jgi:Na+-transporting methylmalonyl-CoA/oxaloacetate decarboxylase gamma subunit
VSSLLVSVLLLCPAIVVLFAIYMLLVAAVYGMSRLHGSALPPLQRLEKAAGMARQRVNGWAGRLNQQAIRWGALAAPLESLFTQLEALFKETNRDPNE